MKRFFRLFVTLVLNLFASVIILYLTENKSIYTKILILFSTSGLVTLLSILIKGYINLTFYFIIYGLISVSTMSCLVYYEIFNYREPFVAITATTMVILMLVVILSELYMRMRVKRVAEGCLNGEPLDSYVRSPWLFLDEKKKKTMCVLYFDTPDLGKIAAEVKANTVIKTLNYIFAKSMEMAKKYNATVIRRSEDSILMVMEPYEKVDRNTNMDPDNECAYNAVLCGLELKQLVDDMKERIDSSPVKRLKGRVMICTDSGVMIKNIRLGKLEFSLFTDAMSRIDGLAEISNGEDLIIDSNTYALCSDYFSVKSLSKKAYSVMGLSGY